MFKKWFGKKQETPQEQAPVTTESAEEVQEAQEEAVQKKSRWSFLKLGFQKTRDSLKSIFGLRGKLDDDSIEQIEAELFTADFGPDMVYELIDGDEGLKKSWKQGKIENKEEVLDFLKNHLKGVLGSRDTSLAKAESGPTVYLVAGVNGTGKTTSIAKIANRLKNEGNSVILAAADTFRAAAVEQLTIWSQRLGIEIVTGKPQADPASVAYKGVERALEVGADCLIVDTAGRLHTDKNLMRELLKIRNVITKKIPEAPHEALLVLDSTNGQNAIQQAEAFKKEIDITGIVLTKLDGTAKGGVVFAIHQRLDIPVKLVGVGEQIENLATFDPDKFVDALFEGEESDD